MFSKALFKQAVRSNYKIFLIFLAVLCLYLAAVCAVFTRRRSGRWGDSSTAWARWATCSGI